MSRPLIFVHQYFTPELAGSAQQLTDLALGLKERGYAIQVVTAQPSYSSKGKFPARENLKGIEIYRVPKIQLSRQRALGRILSAVSFFLFAVFRTLFFNHRTLLVIGSDPPFLPILGWLLRKIFGQDYVLIISDLYPDIAVALGELNPRSWISCFLHRLNHLAFAEAREIVVLGETMAQRVEEKFFRDRRDNKIKIIHNWADGERLHPIPKFENPFRIRHHLLDRLVVLFSGNLGKIYNFDDILKAAALLEGNIPVEFLFIGDGPLRQKLEDEVHEKDLRNVRFLPYQVKEELPYSLTSGDLALIPLKKEAAGLCVPGKLYYALAGGLPLLVIAPEISEPAQIVLKYECGWWLPPDAPHSVARLLIELAKNPSLLETKKKRARECFEKYFTRDRALRQYESVFSNA